MVLALAPPSIRSLCRQRIPFPLISFVRMPLKADVMRFETIGFSVSMVFVLILRSMPLK